MERTLGFSTGALAFGDFRRALNMLRSRGIRAVELSALRQPELGSLSEAIGELDLSSFKYVAVHAPSSIARGTERQVVNVIGKLASYGWPIVVHPDAIHDFGLWRELGAMVCVENMDKRKPIGRTVDELAVVFEKLPDASLCFDLGHARQVDATMSEAYLIVKTYQSKLRQLHVSEVNTSSRHDRLTWWAIRAFQRVADFIPESVPVIVESVVDESEIEPELRRTEEALPLAMAVP